MGGPEPSQLPAAWPRQTEMKKKSLEYQDSGDSQLLRSVPLCNAPWTERRMDSRTGGLADRLLPVIESNEAALVLASYGRWYRSGDASSGITLFIFVN